LSRGQFPGDCFLDSSIPEIPRVRNTKTAGIDLPVNMNSFVVGIIKVFQWVGDGVVKVKNIDPTAPGIFYMNQIFEKLDAN
jgi:hypothetical protein